MEQTLTKEKFDYSFLTIEEKSELLEKEKEAMEIVKSSTTQLGKLFYEAQQLLAKHNVGKFEGWFTSIGFKKQTVYRLISRYQFVSNCDESEAAVFEELPKSLSYEIAKPDQKPQIVSEVLAGNITKNKEYLKLRESLEKKDKELKEQEEKLKEKDDQLKSKQITINNLMNREPEVREVEVLSEDAKEEIERLTYEKERAEEQVEKLSNDLKSLEELKAKKDEIDELSMKIKDSQMMVNNFTKQYNDIQKVFKYIDKAKQVINTELFPIPMLSFEGKPSEIAKKEISSLVEILENLIVAMNEKFSLRG